MTLVPFPPEAFDALTLRLVDLAATLRAMAATCRDNGVDDLELHFNKVNEWLANLEDWTHEGAGRLEAAVLKRQGAQRAREWAGRRTGTAGSPSSRKKRS